MSIVFLESFGQYRDHEDLGGVFTLEEAGATSGRNLSIEQDGPTSMPAQTQSPRSPLPSCLKFLGLSDDLFDATILKIDVTAKVEYIIAFNFRADNGQGTDPTKSDNHDTIMTVGSGTVVHESIDIEHDEDDTTGVYLQIEFSISTDRFRSIDMPDDEGLLLYGRWYYLEFRFLIDNTVGELELRVDGVEWFNSGGFDTDAGGGGDIDNVRFRSGHPTGSSSYGSGLGYSITDIMIIDPNVAGFQDFPFPAVIDLLYPSADTAQLDFTPETGGDNSAMVDESPKHDYDSTHNEANIAADEDRFDTTGSVPFSGFGSVLAVQVVSIVKDTLDTGARTFRSVVFENATKGNGTTVTLTESQWQAAKSIFEDNPDTSLPWTNTEVEAAEIGYEIVT